MFSEKQTKKSSRCSLFLLPNVRVWGASDSMKYRRLCFYGPDVGLKLAGKTRQAALVIVAPNNGCRGSGKQNTEKDQAKRTDTFQWYHHVKSSIFPQ